MDITLRAYPTINQDWLDKNEDTIQSHIWERGSEDFCSYNIKDLLSGTKEQESDFLRAYELRSERMCHEHDARNHHIYIDIPEWFKSRLEDHCVWNTKITDETVDDYNQAVFDTAHDVAWGFADLWYEVLKVKPSWAHDTIKEDWAKLDPPKEIWWDENPITDTETRILYERLTESRYFNDNGLWNRIENKGHTLKATENQRCAIEYQANGEHWYGDKVEYDEDGIPTEIPACGWGAWVQYSLNP